MLGAIAVSLVVSFCDVFLIYSIMLKFRYYVTPNGISAVGVPHILHPAPPNK
jgi:hypothetical protein